MAPIDIVIEPGIVCSAAFFILSIAFKVTVSSRKAGNADECALAMTGFRWTVVIVPDDGFFCGDIAGLADGLYTGGQILDNIDMAKKRPGLMKID